MWIDLLLFLPLAVLTNTAVPVSFDPVLIYFASGHGLGAACAYAIAGSGCAGIAGLLDARIMGAARERRFPAWLSQVPTIAGSRFYLWTFLVALTPLPFSIIRLRLLSEVPNAMFYALAIICGRLPRYLLTVYVWKSLSLPMWAGAVLVAAAIAFAVVKSWRTRRVQSRRLPLDKVAVTTAASALPR